MSYGFFGDLNGFIAEGFKSLTLLSHGRAKISNVNIGGGQYYSYQDGIPPRKGEIRIPFVFYENNNPRCISPPPTSGILFDSDAGVDNDGYLIGRLPNSDPPYVYVYSTLLKDSVNGDYGLEIYGDDGSVVFNTNIIPLKIIASGTDNRLYQNINSIAGRDVAVNDLSLNNSTYWPAWSEAAQITQWGIRRVGNQFHDRSYRYDFYMGVSNPVSLNFNRTPTSMIVIDVSHIKRIG